MIPAETVPDGFTVVAAAGGRRALIADRRYVDALRGAGLERPDGWESRLATPAGPAGRGATARVELAGRPARLKRLRRGGLTARLWRDRFPGRRRVLDNLTIPLEAARREVATAAPLALLVERAGPGLYHAWLAVEELDAVDLRTRLAAGHDPSAEQLAAAMALVRRMHDRGVEHRDLNLGNLLVGDGPGSPAFVIDLDRARLHDAPLSIRARLRALRRLERSYVKCRHPSPASEAVRRAIWDDYAADDPRLARRLERGRRAGRLRIGLHRLTWPR